MVHSGNARDTQAATATATATELVVVVMLMEVVVVVTVVVATSAGSIPYRRSRLGRDGQSCHPMRCRSDQGS